MLEHVPARLFGRLAARRIARRFNRITLRRLVRDLRPDVIFFGDGFFHFPYVHGTGATIYADVQDDFDETDERLLRAEIGYGTSCYAKCERVYAVSSGTADRLSTLYGGPRFEWLPNGADFERFRQVPQRDLEKLRRALDLEHRLVLSYIGSPVWLDEEFTGRLAERLISAVPDAVILVVGSVPRIRAQNVVAVGFVDPAEIHRYFMMSDVGILPKATDGSLFLYHSLPLRMIQYAAARKPVVSPRIKWLEEQAFSNVSQVPLEAEAWIETIRRLRNFAWSSDLDARWSAYDWDRIGRVLATDIGEGGGKEAWRPVPWVHDGSARD